MSDPVVLGLIAVISTLAGAIAFVVKWKSRRDTMGDETNHVIDGALVCQAGKFETRLAILEEHRRGVDGRLRKIDEKLDRVAATTGSIAVDMATVKAGIEWMRKDIKKRNGDSS